MDIDVIRVDAQMYAEHIQSNLGGLRRGDFEDARAGPCGECEFRQACVADSESESRGCYDY